MNLQVNRAAAAPVQQYHSAYRNDIYDRTGGYDIPRNVRNNYYANIPTNGTQRRSNLHLDIRPRCPPNHQHSFDDTESCYYGSSNYSTYERIRDEPVYQNSGNPLYGRLDVIGHGIGRIERHLSSSCGNIDHYNIGGHYAILNQSYVNPMMMNQSQIQNGNPQTSKDGVKSLFSCLGGENSQSLSSVNDNNDPNAQPSTSNAQRSTGAIPKLKNKQTNKVSPKPPISSSPPVPANPDGPDKPNFTKNSLQYLVMNKWLPLPLGSDYKLIDFNFMFSRNCSTSGMSAADGVVQFNGQAEMVESGVYQPQAPREYPMMNNGQYPRVIRNVTPQLSRLRESEAENAQYENAQREMYRIGKENFRARSESPSFNGPRQQRQQDDPFRNWSFNFENNSFRPANGTVRRITDGTLAPKDYQEQNPRKELPTVFIEPESSSQEQPTTSKSISPSSENSNPSASTSSSSGTVGKTSEMKKSENYDNLASLQQEPLPSTSTSDGSAKNHKKKSTESSDSVTLAEEDEDNDDPFDELESDID